MTSLHRRRSALPVFTVLALGTTLALAGCATTDTAEEAVEATDTAAAQAAPERVASGVTGEIADVADGLMQVQDTESQTAVSYTDDTTITAQVSGSLSDLEVGDCVFVTTDAADATVACRSSSRCGRGQQKGATRRRVPPPDAGGAACRAPRRQIGSS